MWAMVRSFGPADPVDALVGLLRGLAQFAVGGLLVGRDHSPADMALVGDPPRGSAKSVYSRNSTRWLQKSILEFLRGDEGFECFAGVLEECPLPVADGVLALVSDFLYGVLIGTVGRQVDELDALQGLLLLCLREQ